MEMKFSKLFRFTSGKPVSFSSEGKYPVYGSNGIVGYSQSYKYKNKLIIGRVGACGSVAYCENEFNATDNTLIAACDEELITYRYAYYLLKFSNLNSFAGGVAQPLITQNLLNHLKCNVPEIAEQNNVVSCLLPYDELIENNNERIKLLEQTSENLYKEWFVRFRFPAHEQQALQQSSWGQIPKSFRIAKMQEVITYHIGGGWGNDDKSDTYPIEAYVIRGTDFQYVEKGDLSSCPLRFHKESNFASRQLKADDIIIEISGGTAEQPVGRAVLVSEDLFQRLNGAVICASFCKLVRLDKSLVSPLYFHYWMKYLYETRIIEKFQLQSTGIINFKFDYFLRKGEILLPDKDLLKAFEEQVLPLRAEIEVLAKQNQSLTRQRDMLLPRLLSGKLQLK